MAGKLEPIGATLPAVLATLVARQPLSPGKLAFAWRTAVGPAIDRATRIRRRPDGTLVVEVAGGPWRREIEAGRSLIEARLAACLGDDFASLEIRGEGDSRDGGEGRRLHRPLPRRRRPRP